MNVSVNVNATSATTFDVVEESIGASFRDVLAVFNATRRTPADEARFDWLYRRNPDGPAVVWTLRDGCGQLVGFTAAIPRRVVVGGSVQMCWYGSDFSILPRYRTLGLAQRLRRAAKEGIDAGRAAFLYAHPNKKMAVIHSRVGHTPVGRMLRYAKLLRTDGQLVKLVKSRAVARSAAALVDPLLGMLDWARRGRRVHTVRLLSPATFDDRFDPLFEESAPPSAGKFVGVRDARYLTWRWGQNPLRQAHVLVAELGSRLCGFLVFNVQDGVVYLKDLFPPDETVVADLLAALADHGRSQGLDSITFVALEQNPLLPIMERFGYRRRPETSEMYAYCPPDRTFAADVAQPSSWFLTVGDRDV